MTSSNVYNFSAGPAMLPSGVMQKVQQEFLSWQGRKNQSH